MATRDYWNHPGGNNCHWNVALGDQCSWGAASDPDTIDLRNGGFINSPDNYGACIWVSQSASNPTATFSGKGADYENPLYKGSGTPITVTAHLVPGSFAPGPYPGDNQYCFIDTVGHPGMYYHFSPLQITSYAAGDGPFNSYFGAGEDATSDLFATDWETQKANGLQQAGVIRWYDIDPNQNPSRMSGTALTAIQHKLRYMHDSKYYKANAAPGPDYPNGTLNPNSWPEYYQDFQSGINIYTGNLIYGTTVGIPANVTMPATNPQTGQAWTNAGKQIWWTLQHYGAVSRDQAGGGFHLSTDQNVPASWVNDANADLPAIVQFLCPLRNQHQGGQDFTLHPMNGPGNRLDAGPPPLAQATATPSPTFTPSPNDTVVTAGSGSSITDASGTVWTITTAGQVAINGVADTTTANVIELAYVNGTVWHENSGGYWYSRTSTGWSAGTQTSPLPGGTTTSSGPQLLPAGYLSTSGNQIVDQNGNPVRIASIGWNGGDGVSNAPQGLNDASLSGMMSQIVALGFNCIRIAYNDHGYFSGGGTYITSSGANPSLAGLTPLQVLDAIVSAAAAVKLKIILDHHTSDGGTNGWGGQQQNGLWYDMGPGTDGTDGGGNTGTITQAAFKNNWVALASRYAGNSTVIGFDLHNEPLTYGNGQNPRLSWGDGNTNDIHAMYVNVGNAILAANPGLLIICEGVIDNGTLGVKGFNLTFVKNTPVTLNVPNKVVYSTHSYPKAISGDPYDSGTQYISDLNAAWGYIVSQNIAPIWIGEIGASLNGDGDSAATSTMTAAQVIASEQTWADGMVAYLNGTASGGPTFSGAQQPIGTCWWLWGDLTGQWPDGVLTGGWAGTARPEQQAVYSKLQFTKVVTTQAAPPSPVLTVGTPSTVSVPLSWTAVPVGATSADQTIVLTGTTGSIIDASKNVWTITTGGQVAVNSVPDTTTSSVVELAYVSGTIWQKNSAGYWYGKKSPTDTWSAGTLTSPLGSPTTYQPQYRLHSATAWTNFQAPITGYTTTVTGLLSGTGYDFRVVATNSSGSAASSIGTATTATPAGTTTPTAPSAPGGLSAAAIDAQTLSFSWSPSVGTAPITYQAQYRLHQATTTPTPTPTTPTPTPTPTTPTPTPAPTPTTSPNNTVVNAGSTAAIVDASGNQWTITTGGQVAVNGVPDGTTSAVIELAYVNGTVWQENSSGFWYGKTSPTAAWSPPLGTTTSPLPGSTTPPPSSSGTLIVAPLASATAGTWTTATINGMTYGMLLPSGYDSSKTYPVVVYMHQFSWGSYGFDYLRTNQLDPWFNTAAWRKAYPSIVLAPMCDQGTPNQDANINWGGVDPSPQAAQNNMIALLKQTLANYPCAPNKVYVTGNSMGGIGSWDDIIKYNRLTGTQDKLFSAALIMAGATYDHGSPTSSGGVPPDPSVVSSLFNVPIWAIHGSQDTNVPLDWDRAMYSAIGRPVGGKMSYTEDGSLGHDVWDTYYPQTSVWDWLFSQTV